MREKQTLHARIEILTEERTRNGKMLIKGVIVDRDGNYAECVWFNRRLIMKQFQSGDEVIIF